jgi:DNA-binding helix-hairpin-helix protein with protein kinase domain
MSTQFVDHTGRAVHTGKLLGKGGQGSVYEVVGNPDVVAKIFHTPASTELAQKLKIMTGLANPQLLKVASWPTATLHAQSANGATRGFVMPRVSGYEEVHQLHGPKSRLAVFPKADWRFLIHVAANTSRALANLHQIGVVMGDVNDRNVLVSQQGTVRLIDCDSFQVSAGGQVFLCPVGVGTHTPPELQGKALDQTQRSANHDAFGLGVLIFQLLFMGRHPFSGRFLGGGDQPPIEKAIAEGRFAYGNDASQRQMSPPPHTLPLEALSPEVVALFRRAFATPPVQRPTATEWVQSLTRLQAAVVTCKNSPNHQFLNTLAACPWCQIEQQTGIVLFSVVTAVSSTTTTGFDLDRIWARIAAVPSPGPLPSLAISMTNVPAPSARAAALGKARKRRRIMSVGITSAVVLLFLVAVTAIGNVLLLFAAVIAVLIAYAYNRLADREWQKSLDAAETALHLARQRESELLARWNALGPESFAQRRAELEANAHTYRDLPQRRTRELQAMERDSRARQLHRYLDRQRIDRARIKDIGPTRSATLQSYGIETAADVTANALANVPGFGPKLTQTMLDWRRQVESRFVYNPRVPVDPADIADLDRRLQKVRTDLERALLSGPEALQQTARRIADARAALQPELLDAILARLQAEADVQAH